ncbi:Crp/Fnr family transcriptional regulator [Laribacter hongkongensis]|uniref:Crp/Fnr family transcriptional regulator n=1 Tax=Laribacter hongkongensis TaxID=168471 RepID=A0A248LIS5_9NEIS|nr:Crp/Fnr family transcriptional regulator [Laribacter hongkongensis]ASJ24364.1 Crp/Fnr family transcriptional regulator [Laribacter hongkongensis]MCG9042034.1 Crp/Fnr family transcriptional regulator [Laribacter hongkongensis]MCG9069070.1 Crp/Fnr family transcriptional regulator [Laribacter hongkongensis]MCG9087877.1 Crp/Fnr family transcriptional regulator [Laribacter hongkongensis]MCG9110738.1 Crp/Fnr family transcriptional regulator [Laribacter hongkongensis]
MGASNIEVMSLLRHQPLFQHLSLEKIGTLVPHTHEIHGFKGQFVFQKGDSCDGMFLVVYGRVKLTLTSAKGNEKIIEIIHPGQSFGEAVMFLGLAYPVAAQLLEDSMLLKVNGEGILRAVDDDPGFSRCLLSGLSLRLHGLVRDVERYSIESSLQRVIGYLLQCISDSDECLQPRISLAINKNLLASRLNLTPETFSRMLHQLTEAGLIKVEGRDITLTDIGKLKDYGNRKD